MSGRGGGTCREPIAPGYTRPAMTHVFVAPHPDDVALSCGGLIASLRELGQNVTILTLYSGSGSAEQLTPYQREALGFGSKAVWPVTEAFNRAHLEAEFPEDASAAPWQATKEGLDVTQGEADAAAKRFWQRSSWYRRAKIHNESLAGQPLIDDLPTQGAVLTTELTEAAAAGDTMAQRRLEDERFAAFAEVSVRLAGPAGRRLPRLRGRRPAPGLAARGRSGARGPAPPRDRAPGAVPDLPAAGHRRARGPPAGAGRRHRAPPRRAGLGDARPGLRGPDRLLRGLPLRVVGGLRPPRGHA